MLGVQLLLLIWKLVIVHFSTVVLNFVFIRIILLVKTAFYLLLDVLGPWVLNVEVVILVALWTQVELRPFISAQSILVFRSVL